MLSRSRANRLSAGRDRRWILVVGLSLASTAVGVGSSAAQVDAARGTVGLCFGQTPTIVGEPGVRRIFGTDGPDVIVPAPDDETPTQIYAAAGDDLVCGDSNYVFGGPGDDKLRGGPLLKGAAGDDLLVPHEQAGSLDPIDLYGGRDDDVMRSGPEPDVYWFVASGRDVIHGSGDACDMPDPDTCDHAVVEGDVDLVSGVGAGAFGTVRLDGLFAVSGSIEDDVIKGSARADWLDGGPNGRDLIVGRRGDDHLSGLNRGDRLRGGAGDDDIDGGSEPDRVHGGSGDDAIRGGGGPDVIDGGSGRDECWGNDLDTFRHCEVIHTPA